MQFSGSSRGGPAALITAITLIMLGAMTFAVPPSRIEVSVTGVERGYLVSHSRFSASLAHNVAADGYTYLAIDLTTAEAGDDAHWSGHLDRVNEVQFPIWGWIELGSAAEQEAVRLAQGAIVAHASALELLKHSSSAATMARTKLEASKKQKEGLTDEEAKKRIDQLIKEQQRQLVEAERKAAVRTEEAGKAAARAEDSRKARKHASAEWKLKELVPGLNLRGIFLVGPGAIARARQFAADNSSLVVLPVVLAGADRPEGPQAVAFEPNAFTEGAKGVNYPVLLGAGLKLGEIEELRLNVDGNYLVATVAVGN